MEPDPLLELVAWALAWGLVASVLWIASNIIWYVLVIPISRLISWWIKR